MVCPFGVISREPASKMIIKCDRCPDRPEPACVEACPVGALVYTEPVKVERDKRRGIIKNIMIGGLKT